MPATAKQPLTWILALALALGALGLRWGLPGLDSWSNDAPAPRPPLEFGRIWLETGHKYPNLQLGLDRLLYSPYLRWLRARGDILPDCSPLRDCFRDEQAAMSTLITLSRLRSLAAFVGLVLGVHALAAALGLSRRAALWAALWAALSAELAFFGKLDNLDLPYSFWLVWALVAWLWALQRGGRRDDVAFGVLAALAVTTKDQAFAAFLLPGLALLWARWREARSGEPGAGNRAGAAASRTAAGKAVLARFAVLVAAAGIPFALINNLLFNWAGFVSHVTYFVGDGGQNEMLHGSWRPAVKLDLARQYLTKTGRSMAWPSFVLALAGIGAWHLGRPTGGAEGQGAGQPAPRRRVLWLWSLPFLSYYLFLILPLKVVDTRFTIPMVALLCIPAGDLAARLWGRDAAAGPRPAIASPSGYRERGRSTAALVSSRALLLGVAAYAFLYSLNMGLAMRADSRYGAEDFLRRHLRPESLVVGMDESRHLPRIETLGIGKATIIDWEETVGEAGREAREQVQAADVLIISGKTADRLEGEEAELRDRLLAGAAGHSLAWQSRDGSPFGEWLPGAWVEERVSPEIRILVREPGR